MAWKIAKKYVFPLIFTIILATFIVHFMIYYMAPLTIDNWNNMSEDEKHFEKQQRGLDINYLKWWFSIFSGDLGTSIRDGQKVSVKVLIFSANTIKLAVGALFLSTLLSSSIAFWQAFKSKSRIPRIISSAVSFFSSLPTFLLSLFIWLIYTITKNDIPNGIYAYLFACFALSLGDGIISEMLKHLSDSADRLLSQEFMIAVRVRKLNVTKHFLKNMWIPIISITSSRFALLISATIIVEYLFNYRGIGWLTLNSMQTQFGLRDYPVIMATTLVMVTIVAIIRLLCSILYPIINPKLRH